MSQGMAQSQGAEPESSKNREWWPQRPQSVVPPASRKLPPWPSYESRPHPRAGVGTAIVILILGITAGGALYLGYVRGAQPAPNPPEAAVLLPRSGQSASAYDYVLPKQRSPVIRRAQGAKAAAEKSIAEQPPNYLSASPLDDFVAEVIDGNRHTLIRFARVRVVRVAASDFALSALRPGPAPASYMAPTAPAPGIGGSAVYLPQGGWWTMTRPFAAVAETGEDLKLSGVVASVVLNVTVGADGRVQDAAVVSGPADMAAAAVEAAKHWHYESPLNGAPAQRRVTVNFSVAPQ